MLRSKSQFLWLSFKHRIHEITGRSRGISMERRLSELRSEVRGWMTNAWLAQQALLSIKTLWAHLAPIRRAA
jgi:hypothetical protein